MAKFVLFRRSHRLVADIIVIRDLALYYDGLHKRLYMVSAMRQPATEEMGLVKHDIMLSQPSSRDARQGDGKCSLPRAALVVGHVAAWWDV